MKKYLLISLLLSLTSFSWASTPSLTISDTLTLYFSELFPNTVPGQDMIVLKYSDIGNRPGLYSALQKGIYYGMIPNTAGNLTPAKSMSDRAFSALLQKHFGVSIETDNSVLTRADFDSMMDHIRPSYAYMLLTRINTSAQKTDASPVSHLSGAKNYYILDEVYTILRDNHLDAKDISDEDLIAGAAAGLAQGTGDIYTEYFEPEAGADFQQSLEGKTGGVGIMVDIDTPKSLIVTEVIPESPAEKTGIRVGDRIIRIDTVPVDTTDGVEKEILAIRGKPGTTVTLTLVVERAIQTVELTRAIITLPLVTEEIFNTSYLITYREVGFDSDKTFEAALKNFITSGKKRLIIDLRNNPGGSMLETRNILNFFIDRDNPLVILKYPKNEETFVATRERMADWSSYEIILLVNENTASAAEVIAATLREYFPRNLRIIGKKTYGKGVVQELVSFDDTSLLKYTIAEWLTPKNRTSINMTGIKPDVTTSLDLTLWREDNIDTQLNTAEEYRF